MEKGFTLAELLITIVILAVLTAIAIPNFSNAAEKAKWSAAFADLRVIRTGEQMYFSKNGSYAPAGSKALIKSTLGVDVSETNFTFGVAATATTFTATATRVGATTQKATIDQTGDIALTNNPGYVKDPD